jgi:hypothetical protein
VNHALRRGGRAGHRPRCRRCREQGELRDGQRQHRRQRPAPTRGHAHRRPRGRWRRQFGCDTLQKNANETFTNRPTYNRLPVRYANFGTETAERQHPPTSCQVDLSSRLGKVNVCQTFQGRSSAQINTSQMIIDVLRSDVCQPIFNFISLKKFAYSTSLMICK